MAGGVREGLGEGPDQLPVLGRYRVVVVLLVVVFEGGPRLFRLPEGGTGWGVRTVWSGHMGTGSFRRQSYK